MGSIVTPYPDVGKREEKISIVQLFPDDSFITLSCWFTGGPIFVVFTWAGGSRADVFKAEPYFQHSSHYLVFGTLAFREADLAHEHGLVQVTFNNQLVQDPTNQFADFRLELCSPDRLRPGSTKPPLLYGASGQVLNNDPVQFSLLVVPSMLAVDDMLPKPSVPVGPLP